MPPLEIIDFGKGYKGEEKRFNLEDFLFENKVLLVFVFAGFVLLGVAIFLLKTGGISSSSVEIIESSLQENLSEIVVEVSGAVEKPGVYRLSSGSRVEDGLIVAGGFSATADRDWVERNLNRAAKLSDGQKIFIPDKQSNTTSASKNGGYQNVSTVLGGKTGSLININTASAKELDSLPGIGPVYAQKIIEQRPYSTTEELLSKKVIPKSIFDKIKGRISVW